MVAPLLYLSVGFWMLDNIQIYQNKVIFADNYNVHMMTGHKLSSIFEAGHTHSYPLLIMFVVLLLAIGTRFYWFKLAKTYIGFEKLEDA